MQTDAITRVTTRVSSSAPPCTRTISCDSAASAMASASASWASPVTPNCRDGSGSDAPVAESFQTSCTKALIEKEERACYLAVRSGAALDDCYRTFLHDRQSRSLSSGVGGPNRNSSSSSNESTPSGNGFHIQIRDRSQAAQYLMAVVDRCGEDREVVSVAMNYLDRFVAQRISIAEATSKSARKNKKEPMDKYSLEMYLLVSLDLAIKLHSPFSGDGFRAAVHNVTEEIKTQSNADADADSNAEANPDSDEDSCSVPEACSISTSSSDDSQSLAFSHTEPQLQSSHIGMLTARTISMDVGTDTAVDVNVDVNAEDACECDNESPCKHIRKKLRTESQESQDQAPPAATIAGESLHQSASQPQPQLQCATATLSDKVKSKYNSGEIYISDKFITIRKLSMQMNMNMNMNLNVKSSTVFAVANANPNTNLYGSGIETPPDDLWFYEPIPEFDFAQAQMILMTKLKFFLYPTSPICIMKNILHCLQQRMPSDVLSMLSMNANANANTHANQGPHGQHDSDDHDLMSHITAFASYQIELSVFLTDMVDARPSAIAYAATYNAMRQFLPSVIATSASASASTSVVNTPSLLQNLTTFCKGSLGIDVDSDEITMIRRRLFSLWGTCHPSSFENENATETDSVADATAITESTICDAASSSASTSADECSVQVQIEDHVQDEDDSEANDDSDHYNEYEYHEGVPEDHDHYDHDYEYYTGYPDQSSTDSYIVAAVDAKEDLDLDTDVDTDVDTVATTAMVSCDSCSEDEAVTGTKRRKMSWSTGRYASASYTKHQQQFVNVSHLCRGGKM